MIICTSSSESGDESMDRKEINYCVGAIDGPVSSKSSSHQEFLAVSSKYSESLMNHRNPQSITTQNAILDADTKIDEFLDLFFDSDDDWTAAVHSKVVYYWILKLQ